MGQTDEQSFRRWYADWAQKLGLDPNPDGQFYDYRAAFREGAKPGPDGHWPSKFKMPGHPNEVVAGFNTRTGDRVPGTKRGTRDEMIGLGWEPDTATRLIGMDDLRHSPDMRRVATRSGVAPDADKMQSLIRLLQALP